MDGQSGDSNIPTASFSAGASGVCEPGVLQHIPALPLGTSISVSRLAESSRVRTSRPEDEARLRKRSVWWDKPEEVEEEEEEEEEDEEEALRQRRVRLT